MGTSEADTVQRVRGSSSQSIPQDPAHRVAAPGVERKNRRSCISQRRHLADSEQTLVYLFEVSYRDLLASVPRTQQKHFCAL